MEDTYDVVVCGTGLTECILSGLLSQEGKKVLHIDRNQYYGGEGASLNLTTLWKLFRNGVEPPKDLGTNRDWNIDLIPKFIMANGKLVKILLKTRVAKYLEWKAIDGTYVFQMKEGGIFSKGGASIEKVPSNDSEALKSDLMSFWEKKRCKDFFVYVQKYDQKDPKTQSGLDLTKVPFSAVVKKFELGVNTVDFIGHAVALHTNDDFLNKAAIETVDRIRLYMDSIGRYGDSPFIYPIYGLGGIPEGFSRMCAIFGGTFMLNKDIDKILYDENGKVCGVQSGTEIAKTKMVICNPTYVINTGLKEKVKSTGRVVRCICITDHPIAGTKEIPSIQIIIPQRQVGRKSDIYVMMVSAVHQVCKSKYYIVIISANVETDNPEKELEPAFTLVGPVKEKFVTVSEVWVPAGDTSDGVVVTKSLDATSHFESATEDVLSLYKKITGKELDLVNIPEDAEDG
jgi:Rab GDP dissociation inhibitor